MFGQSQWPDDIPMKKRIVIFGNGRLDKSFLRDVKPDDYIIGVDRAAYWLISRGVVPHVALGDFDSVTKREFHIIQKEVKKVMQYPSTKKWTDMDLAMKHAADLPVKEVIIFGGTGTRMDHTLVTLNLLTHHVLIDTSNRIRVADKGRIRLKPGDYRYISIVPMTNTITLQLEQFKYNLPKTIIRRGSTRTVSNEFIGKPGIITLYAGKAWVIESRD